MVLEEKGNQNAAQHHQQPHWHGQAVARVENPTMQRQQPGQEGEQAEERVGDQPLEFLDGLVGVVGDRGHRRRAPEFVISVGWQRFA
jgi:hypothetical protein